MGAAMRSVALIALLALGAPAADVESRVLTHYVPQDLLEAAVRKEGWTEVPLAVKGGTRKGDVVRVWAGGSIDRGGERPGKNVVGPAEEGQEKTGAGARFCLTADSWCAGMVVFGGVAGQSTRALGEEAV
jgi:hypothetical protein